MNESIFKIAVLIILMIPVISSCKKEADNEQQPKDIKAIFNPNVTYGTMIDQDNNEYKTVTIGTQTWMAENLRTTKYNDGTNIPHVIAQYDWKIVTTGAYCNLFNKESAEIIDLYGRYYNWYAVNTGKLAPNGWHVPTDAEWTILIDYLGGQYIAGGKLKETTTKHWQDSNYEVTNESGFTALPGGLRDVAIGQYEFGGHTATCLCWSATENDTISSWGRLITTSSVIVERKYFNKSMGLTVRLVKD